MANKAAFADQQTEIKNYVSKYGHFTIDETIEVDYEDPSTFFNEKKKTVHPVYLDYVTGIFIVAAEEYDLDPWILVTHSRFETGFRTWRDGDGGASVGLLQVNAPAGHKKRFWSYNDDGVLVAGSKVSEVTRNGESVKLVWRNDLDMVRYCAWHVRYDLDRGIPIYNACSWWSVRDKGAWKEFKRMRG